MRSALTIRSRLVTLTNAVSWHVVMLCLAHHAQVAGIVIGAIAINVVHNLITRQWATKHTLGNHPMLGNSFALVVNDLVALSIRMAALPIPMLIAILTPHTWVCATPNWTLAQLLKAGWTQGWMTKRAVLLRGHTVHRAKVGGWNLHRADHPAQFTFDRIVGHIAPLLKCDIRLPSAVIIPRFRMWCNVG